MPILDSRVAVDADTCWILCPGTVTVSAGGTWWPPEETPGIVIYPTISWNLCNIFNWIFYYVVYSSSNKNYTFLLFFQTSILLCHFCFLIYLHYFVLSGFYFNKLFIITIDLKMPFKELSQSLGSTLDLPYRHVLLFFFLKENKSGKM